MLTPNFQQSTSDFLADIKQYLPNDQYQKVINCLLLETGRIKTLQNKSIDQVTSEDIQKFCGLEKLVDKCIIDMLTSLLKIRKLPRHRINEIVKFIMEKNNYIVKFINDCNLRSNIPKPIFGEWLLQKGQFYKKCHKLLEADAAFREFNLTKSRIAQNAAGNFHCLAALGFANNDLDLAIYASSAAIDCVQFIDDNDSDNKLAFESKLLLKRLELNGSDLRNHVICTSNLSYYMSYRLKRLINQSFPFLIKALKHGQYFDIELIKQSLMLSIELDQDKQLWEFYSLLTYLIPYLQKALNPDLVDPEGMKVYGKVLDNNLRCYSEVKEAMLEQYRKHFTQDNFLSSHHISELHFNDHEMSFSFTYKVKQRMIVQLLSKLREQNVHVIFKDNRFVIENFLSYKKQKIVKIIKTTLNATAPKAQNVPWITEIAQITPVSTTLGKDHFSGDSYNTSTSTTSSTSTSITAPKPPGITTRLAEEQQGDRSLFKKAPLTKKSIGFTTNSPEVDAPVFEIQGHMVPKGVFFAYGLQLDNASSLSKAQIEHHQSILEAGNVVPPGRQGLRFVRPKESGFPYITFKTTIPNADARVFLVKEQEIVDEKGKTKFLYRAGNVKFH